MSRASFLVAPSPDRRRPSSPPTRADPRPGRRREDGIGPRQERHLHAGLAEDRARPRRRRGAAQGHAHARLLRRQVSRHARPVRALRQGRELPDRGGARHLRRLRLGRREAGAEEGIHLAQPRLRADRRPPRRHRHLRRRQGVLRLADQEGRPGGDAADRGAVGVRLPRRHHHRLVQRRRRRQGGRHRLVSGQRRQGDARRSARRRPTPGACTT